MQSETVNDESYKEYKYQIVVVEIKASHFNHAESGFTKTI